MANNDTQIPTVGATWTPPKPPEEMAVSLRINVPEHAQVRRNSLTGDVEIDNIAVSDLVNLRDSISEEIVRLQQLDSWEPL